MKFSIGWILIYLTVAFAWNTPKDEVELVTTQDSGTAAKGRIAIPPPGKIPPIRNGGIMNLPPPLLNPALAGVPPGVPPGAIGLPGVPVFFPPVRISVDPSSQLYVPPGSDGRIVLTLRNDGIGDIFYVSGGDDKNFFLQFDYSQIQLGPSQTININGRIRVPAYAQNVVSTLTVIVQRRTDNAISQRQIYIRTKSESGEKWAPWCTIKTVTKCWEYLDESICAQRFWNMRAEIQDTDSGLLSISIKPDGRFLGEDFPVGTNYSVAVEQTVSCCTTGVDITAVDVRGNVAYCRADQWGIYLSPGDIAAITLGVILLILLLIILIVAICRCCKRRRSEKVKTAPIPRSKKDQA